MRCSCGHAIGHPLVPSCTCKKWEGLTEEEIEQAHRKIYRREASLIDCLFADELEAKLKEKNDK